MADCVKGLYFLVVMAAVGFYSLMIMRGLNEHLSTYYISNIETEMKGNPHMKSDYERFRKEEDERVSKETSEREAREEEMKELQKEALKIQQRLDKLKKSTTKYVKMEGKDDDDEEEEEESEDVRMEGKHEREEREGIRMKNNKEKEEREGDMGDIGGNVLVVVEREVKGYSYQRVFTNGSRIDL
ncbi:hypothetical protein Pmani_000935 [Petrolisthes manimaculis]|uniref:Uncharacterized protein n=1 Tax=Petrolisthes manimaculis TaxID=1843537 RepID=A0AAE1USI0_9EUCA|nr:hypothetical protein Pmani_000935 [Petrolisthes manimaculis]